ncbi:hypothetical protein [Megasphaera sp.]|uniref:hypothetical protein n=1 Tax=Megasphaera sp. TaxID=2023260 RepID=UPI003AAC25E8
MHKQSNPWWKLIMMAALGFSLAVGGEILTLQPVQAWYSAGYGYQLDESSCVSLKNTGWAHEFAAIVSDGSDTTTMYFLIDSRENDSGIYYWYRTEGENSWHRGKAYDGSVISKLCQAAFKYTYGEMLT